MLIARLRKQHLEDDIEFGIEEHVTSIATGGMGARRGGQTMAAGGSSRWATEG
jgi:hypothetical protein